MLLVSLTIFLSSFLLFLVQPMIARIILPWFGGTAAVWGTCMVFFQVTLLCGYLYAHGVVSRMPLRRQRMLHTVLMGAALLFLPLAASARWKPQGGENPVGLILLLLATSIGLPYLVLSTTGPLLQAWFLQSRPGAIPYRLFALSNVGSMLALLAYPTLIEPRLKLSEQALFWSFGFAVFVVCCAAAAWTSMRKAIAVRAAPEAESEEPVAAPGWWARLDWILFSMCPSILLLAVTSHLTQDVASIPFLWIIPLTLYLISFILCFDTDRWYRRWIFFPLGWVAVYALLVLSVSEDPSTMPIRWTVAMVSGCYFVICMCCHGELARRKPHPCHLTLFFLMVSVGGALGGLFVALAAPTLFSGNYELPLGLSLAVYLLIVAIGEVADRRGWPVVRPLVVGVGIIFFLSLGYLLNRTNRDSVYRARNFYGELRVRASGDEIDWTGTRVLLNGAINHGQQFVHPKRQLEPTTYYCSSGGAGMAILTRTEGVPQKVGVVGLGTGTLLAYSRPGDVYRVYDINPLVVRIAREQFYFLRRALGAVEIVMGDARLSMEREVPQNYDVLLVDAFSSDAIPVHLLTEEAIKLYFRHLKPDGILAIHVSNRHVELEPVLEQQAVRLEKSAATVDDRGDYSKACFENIWVLITGRASVLSHPELLRKTRSTRIRNDLPVWTDDYSNLFKLLR